jgi:6-phosphogluconolactonase/glucosamine-6-phosphate isomerase/deaminase
MGKIAVGESSAMVTNVQLDNVTVTPTDEFHVPSTVGESIVHQVAQRTLQPLAVHRDRGLIGLDHDRAAL